MLGRSRLDLATFALLLFGLTAPEPMAVDAEVSSIAAKDVTGSVLALVGDLVPDRGAPGGGLGNADAVHDLMVSHRPAAYLHLGDLQYECGDLATFLQNYDLIWGDKFNDIYPVIGNHEYCNGSHPNAEGYFTYFGAKARPSGASYYSFNVLLPTGGHWHVIVLNSNCSEWAPAPGCGLTQAMENWVRADLAADNARCELAVWHEPAFGTNVPFGQKTEMRIPWWTLEERGVDVIMTGHSHRYERFRRMIHTGAANSTKGISSTIIGVGGKSHTAFVGPFAPNSVAHYDDFYGFVKMVLRVDGWTQAFKTIDGRSLDAVSGGCH